jgi:transcriptional antiterminator NusG
MEQHEVERMLGLEEKREEEPTRVKIEFRIGEVVKIKTGAFESFEGEIESIDEATGKLSVLIEIFGRQTPYEVEYHEVERP